MSSVAKRRISLRSVRLERLFTARLLAAEWRTDELSARSKWSDSSERLRTQSGVYEADESETCVAELDASAFLVSNVREIGEVYF